ncbi:MAG: TetR/AcrR family transcriptional regulator [Polyangiales bacterium]
MLPEPTDKPRDRAEDTKEGPEPRSGPPKQRRTQAERTAESDQRMLQAAMKLIGERGYRGTSLAAIGEEAGYSRGLVNERFGSKDGLLWVLVKTMFRAYKREVRTNQAERAGIDRLCSLVDSHRIAIERSEPIRAFYALMFEAMGPIPQLQPEFQRLHDNFRASIEETVREGIEARLIRADVDPRAQAALLLGALRGIGFQYLLDRQAFPLDLAYGELKQNLRRSLQP